MAKTLNPEANFQVANAEKLPFDDNNFDGVTCNFGILHFPNPEKAMAEAYRVCKDGARYAYAIWNTPDKSPAMSFMIEAIEKHAVTKVELPEGPPFFHYSAKENSISALEKIGFKDINFKEIDAVWKMDSAKSFVEYFRDGGARTGAYLRAHPPKALENIINYIDKNIQQYKTDAGYMVPVSMIIVSGQK